MSIHATRYHDISCGHRVVGHTDSSGESGPCARIHGHNYRIHFTCTPRLDRNTPLLDNVGRVIDFSEIKNRLCKWLDQNWDHRFLIWKQDPIKQALMDIDSSVVEVDFNPTAENIAQYLVETVGPEVLPSSIVLTRCIVDETRKCSAEFEISIYH